MNHFQIVILKNWGIHLQSNQHNLKVATLENFTNAANFAASSSVVKLYLWPRSFLNIEKIHYHDHEALSYLVRQRYLKWRETNSEIVRHAVHFK